MRPLGEVSSLFICLILSRLFNAVTSVVYVENGTSLTLNPNIQGKPEDILWTHNGNKVAEHDLSEFLDYGQFKGRSEIEVSTGQLTVHNMTSRDNGIYRSVIQISGKLQNTEKEVEVMDAVPEPIVTCKLNNISRALLCSVSSQSHVSYEWTGSSSAERFGPELLISREETPDSVYTCTVKNEVSQKKTSFSLKHCDTADEPQSDQNIILAVAVSFAVLAIIAVAVGIYLIIQKKKKNNGNSNTPGGEKPDPPGGSSGNQASTEDSKQRGKDCEDEQKEEADPFIRT